MFSFDPNELEGIALRSVQERHLTKFGFNPHRDTSHELTSIQESSLSGLSQTGFTNNDIGEEKINMLIPKYVNSSSASISSAVGCNHSGPPANRHRLHRGLLPAPRLPSNSLLPTAVLRVIEEIGMDTEIYCIPINAPNVCKREILGT